MGLRPTNSDEHPRDCGSVYLARNGRGRNRSGCVEAVREFDPGRAFGTDPCDITLPEKEGPKHVGVRNPNLSRVLPLPRRKGSNDIPSSRNRGSQESMDGGGDRCGSRRDGVHRAILETNLVGSGAALPPTASGASALPSRAEWPPARLRRCATTHPAAAGRGIDLELRAGFGTAWLADHHPRPGATGAGSSAAAESAGSSA